MGGFSFRIGTKLAASAGIGALLVVGIIANQQLSDGSVGQSTVAAISQQKQARDVLRVDNILRKGQLARRVLVTLDSADEVTKRLDALRKDMADGESLLETASKRAPLPEARERLTKAKALLGDYTKAVAEIGTLQKEVIDSRTMQIQLDGMWTKAIEALLASPVLAGLSNRHDVEAALRDANAFMKDGRIAFWSYSTTSNAELIGQLARNLDKATELLKHARDAASERALTNDINALFGMAKQMKGVMTSGVNTMEAQAGIQHDRALPLGTEISGLVEAVVQTAGQLADVKESEAAATMTQASRIGLGAGVLVILILIGSTLFSMFTIARPIRRIGEVLLELANGNKTVEIPYADRGDEVGDNARAAKTFKDNLLRIEQMEAAQKAAQAQAVAERKADMHKLANGFEAAVGDIVGTVSASATALEAAASTLTQTADTTQQLSTKVAGASGEASANVQSVASASEQLTSSVNEISRQVQESSRIAREAVTQADKTDARIGELSQAASRIGDVVKLITDIAEQTNLLALNATIEAARAGEAGKGFAVVAQEVKALAAQTAKATDQIGTQITSMQTATQDSVAAIKEIGGTIRRVSEIAAAISATVEEQSAATQEISRNVQQAAQGTAQVAANIANVSKGAEETGSASSQVLTSAQALAHEGNRLKLEVDKFLVTVRAA
ncbi:MAG: methyl-accepting chemotaxis protein [Xanthobacteraceae bacterium]